MKPILILIFSCLAATAFSNTLKYDSVGVEEVDGQVFILHKVETEETLYSVSRRYNVSIYKIIESNPPTEYGLKVGQVIKIPYLKKTRETRSLPEKQLKTQLTVKNTIHTVAPKETLFAISRQYNVSVDELKQWNNLASNSLDIGQKLIIKKPEKTETAVLKPIDVKNGKTHIVKQSETLYSISRLYNVAIEDIKGWNGLTSNEIGIGQELIVSRGNAPEVKNMSDALGENNKEKPSRMDSALIARNSIKNKPAIDSESNKPVTTMETSSAFGEIVESGVATLIEGSENTRKYLALHRTASVGTIMRVHNEMNGQEVFVRVLGKLPDTGVNKNVIIRISKSAYDRLGAIDPKFRVKISYIP